MYGTYVWRFRHHGVTAPRGSATAPLFSVLPPSQLAMAVHPSISAPAAFLLLLVLASAGLVESLSVVGRVRLKLGFGKALREDAVARYFEGVTTKNRELIASCFPAEGASIRDVCGLSQDEKTATRDQLADRCMEFVAAHPRLCGSLSSSSDGIRWKGQSVGVCALVRDWHMVRRVIGHHTAEYTSQCGGSDPIPGQ